MFLGMIVVQPPKEIFTLEVKTEDNICIIATSLYAEKLIKVLIAVASNVMLWHGMDIIPMR